MDNDMGFNIHMKCFVGTIFKTLENVQWHSFEDLH
jgi:hypothetical protein